MSNFVDNRVVELQFNNKQFEEGVATTMSTLDKFKEKLNFKGATDGIDKVGETAKRFHLNGMTSAIDAINVKFSAMQVAGIAAVTNITNSALRAGKAMTSALTVDPVKTGLQEYETQIGAIQTILANTQHQGTNLQQVNKALAELNTYADKTIYNFTQMTKNIGTFTAAGIDLRTSTDSIKGIANLAAVSGSTAQQASTAMYQLSQALAAGRVSLQDWNSVVNAGMGGKVFQNALMRTSDLLKTNGTEMVKSYGSFRESLTEGKWLTNEVLTETLKQFAGAYSEADLIAQGYTETQAKEIVKMAETAEKAATQVKTFSQLWDTLKESAQSGWTKSWEIMIGDFEEARTTLTEISDSVSGLIGKSSDARNKLLSEGLSTGWKQLLDQGVGDEEAFIKRIEKVARKSGDSFDKIVEESTSFTEALQTGLKEGAISSDTLSTAVIKLAKSWSKMSQKQLKAKGFSTQMVRDINALADGLKDGSVNMDEFTEKILRPSGRQNIIDGLWNSCRALFAILKPIGEAFRNVFPSMTGDQLYDITVRFKELTEKLMASDKTANTIRKTFEGLFSIVKRITDAIGGGLKLALSTLGDVLNFFSKGLSGVTVDLGDVMKALADRINPVIDLIGTGLKSVIPVLGAIAKAIINFVKSVASLPVVSEAIDNTAKTFKKLADTAKKFKDIIAEFKFDDLLKYLDELTGGEASKFASAFKEIGVNTVGGLISGLSSGGNSIASVIISIGQSIIETIKGLLGIHSPSTVMFDIGKNITDGLHNGIESGIASITNLFKLIQEKVVSLGQSGIIDWNKIFAIGMIAGIGVIANKLMTTLDHLMQPIRGFGNLMNSAAALIQQSTAGIVNAIANVGMVIQKFQKVVKAIAFEKKTEGIKNLAISIAILVGAIYVLTKLDIKEVAEAVGVIMTLAITLGILAVATSKMSEASVKISKDGANIKTLSNGLIGIASSLFVISAAAKMLGKMSDSELEKGLGSLAGITVGIVAVMLAFFGLSKKFEGSTKDFGEMGKSLLALSVAMLILTKVVKIAGGFSKDQAEKGIAFAVAFLAFVWGLVAITKVTKNTEIAQLGGLVLSISIAMGIMAGVVKLVGKLKADEMKKGAVFAAAFLGFILVLTGIAVVAKAGGGVAKLAGLVLSISIAMGLMVGVVKLVNTLNADEMKKGALFAAAFAIFLAAITKATTISSTQQTAKLTGTILAMTIAMGALAALCVVLGFIDLPSLAKGVVAMTVLGVVFAGMLYVSKEAEKAKGSLTALTIAVGLMSGALVALSFIDPKRLAGAVLAMTILMGMFVAMEAVGKYAKDSMAGLIALTVVTGVLAGVVILLTKIKVEDAMPIIKQIGILGAVMAAALIVFGSFGSLALPAIAGVAAATVVIGVIGGLSVAIGKLMSKVKPETISKWQNGLDQFMEFIRILAQGVGEAIGSFIGGIGVGLAKSMEEMGTSLSNFMDNMKPFFDSLTGLEKGPVLAGIGTLVAVMLGVGAVEVINALTSLLPFTSSIVMVGLKLGLFAQGLIPFTEAIKHIDADSITAVTNLGKMIAALTVSSVLDGITKLVTGSASFSGLGDQLTQFADAIIPFSNKLSEAEIDTKAINTAANAGKMMAALQKSIPKSGGWAQEIFGENDWSGFNEGIQDFGDAIIAVNDALSGASIDTSVIETATNAGALFTELQNKIPKTGGWLQNILGQSDWEIFNAGIKGFGDAITTFNDTIGAITINEDQVKSVTNAGKALAAVQKAIPEDKWFDGKTNLSDFGEKITAFGDSMSAYTESVTDLNVSVINASINAANRFNTLSQSLANFDSESFSNFDVSSLGKSLKSYAEKLSGFSMEEVSLSVSAVNELVHISSSIASMNSESFKRFAPVPIANALKDYASTMNGVNLSTITASISAANKVKSFINSLGSMDTSGVGSFKSAVSSLGETDFSSMTSAFSSAASKMSSSASSLTSGALSSIKSSSGSFGKAGSDLAGRMVSGFSAEAKKMKNAASSAVSSAASAIRSHRSSFSTNGGYLASGLVSGINAKKSAAYNAGYALGKAAVDGEKAGQKSKSPSKATIQAGNWLGEGLVIGMKQMESSVYRKSHDVGETAANSMSKAASRITNFINEGMDSEPTIRPVLDLTDVRSGVNAVNGMMNFDPSISASMNLSSINTLSNQRQMMKNNNDVVASIDKLRGSLVSSSGDTITINGITYDDGTNVSDAVRTLVRAARVERRA